MDARSITIIILSLYIHARILPLPPLSPPFPPVPSRPLPSSLLLLADAQFADLLAPNSAVTIDSLGIRITQWEESGAFMVKLQNIGNNRVKLSEALFTMPESDARRDTTGK